MTEQGTVPHQAASGSDEQALLQRLRGGEDSAFGELFESHVAAVRRLARSIASDQSEAEDITAETFFRVLQALRRGAGPREYVRAYLLTVARRVSWEWHGARRDVPVSDDELTFRAGAGADTHAYSADHTLITTAFTSLPERWRTVLWQTEVEGEQPAMVAPHFGLSANATAALARRARQGLRAAYLQAHLSVNRSSDGCRAVVEKLGGYTAGSVTGSEARRIRAHLLGCSSCRSTHDELRDVCSSLRVHAGVLVLLVPAAGFGASSATGGLAAALKSLLLGSKVKVGLALVSTAAAGAFGIAVGPAVFSPDSSRPLGLPGDGSPELTVVEAEPSVAESAKAAVGTGRFTVQVPEPAAHPVRSSVSSGVDFGSVNGSAATQVIAAGAPGTGLLARDEGQPADTGTQPRSRPRLDTATPSTTKPRKSESKRPPYSGIPAPTEATKPPVPSLPTIRSDDPAESKHTLSPLAKPRSKPSSDRDTTGGGHRSHPFDPVE
jgi:RNA polymerase sigma factor (sigma-70 family)